MHKMFLRVVLRPLCESSEIKTSALISTINKQDLLVNS